MGEGGPDYGVEIGTDSETDIDVHDEETDTDGEEVDELEPDDYNSDDDEAVVERDEAAVVSLLASNEYPSRWVQPNRRVPYVTAVEEEDELDEAVLEYPLY